jgi:hypothetical protein
MRAVPLVCAELLVLGLTTCYLVDHTTCDHTTRDPRPAVVGLLIAVALRLYWLATHAAAVTRLTRRESHAPSSSPLSSFVVVTQPDGELRLGNTV